MNPSQLGILSSLLASVTWAFGSATYAELSHRYSAAVINTTRASVALITFILAIALLDPEASSQSFAHLDMTHLSWLLVSMIASYAFGDYLFLLSAKEIGAPLALTLASIYPLWSAIVGIFWRGESLLPMQFFGLVLTSVGVAIVVLAGSKRAAGERKPAKWGYLTALLTSVLWSVNTVAVARGGEGLSTLVTGSVRMAIALVLCPSVGILMGQKMRPPIVKIIDLKRYGWLFLLESFGGTIFFVYGFAHASLAVAGALSSLAPVLSVPISYFIYKHPVSWQKAGGIVIVTIGLILLLIR